MKELMVNVTAPPVDTGCIQVHGLVLVLCERISRGKPKGKNGKCMLILKAQGVSVSLAFSE